MNKDDVIKEIVKLIPDRRYVSHRFFNCFTQDQLQRYLREFQRAGELA